MQIESCVENTVANGVGLRIIDIEEKFRVTRSCIENTLTLNITSFEEALSRELLDFFCVWIYFMYVVPVICFLY